MKPSLKKNWHQAVQKFNLNIDRQVCVIKTVAYRARTDTHTIYARAEKKVKTEGPKILSNDIFYFKTVMIIGGPKRGLELYNVQVYSLEDLFVWNIFLILNIFLLNPTFNAKKYFRF